MKGREVLPNPGDMFQSLRYLQDQAARGRFKDHASAHHVMLYLVMNMWVKVPNNDDAGLGDVMYGRSSVADIAGHTALSERTVQRALKWLAEERWIEAERTHDSTGREDKRMITVMLDSRAHRERDRIRQAGEAADRILAEARGG